MLVFMFVLLPLALLLFFTYSKERKFQPVFFIGVISATLLCVCKALFVFAHRVVPNSFSDNYFYFLLHESLLPQVILFGLYFLIAKDDVKFKFNSYFPLLCSFYALYLPYCIISSNESEVYSGFCIFVKPVIFLAMLVQCALMISCFVSDGKLKILKRIIAVFLIIIYLFLPALIETLYVMNYMPVLMIVLSAVYSLFPAALCVLKFIYNLKK